MSLFSVIYNIKQEVTREGYEHYEDIVNSLKYGIILNIFGLRY